MKNAWLKMCMVFIVAFVLGCLLTAFCIGKSGQMNMYAIKEPLQIRGNDEGYYFLPIGTVLYYERNFAEGHSLFWTPLYHKGKIDWEEVPLEPKHMGRLVIPLWLENLSAEQMKDVFSHFPLTKADTQSAIRANGLTRDDLADIIRAMPKDVLDTDSLDSSTGSTEVQQNLVIETFLEEKKSVEFRLFDENDKPVAGEAYVITLADGSKREGTLDTNGVVHLDNVPRGECFIEFPNIDKNLTPVPKSKYLRSSEPFRTPE